MQLDPQLRGNPETSGRIDGRLFVKIAAAALSINNVQALPAKDA